MQITVELELKTCFHCGFYYAVQKDFGHRTACPRCRNESLVSTCHERVKLERQCVALRGVITKMKNRAARRRP